MNAWELSHGSIGRHSTNPKEDTISIMIFRPEAVFKMQRLRYCKTDFRKFHILIQMIKFFFNKHLSAFVLNV